MRRFPAQWILLFAVLLLAHAQCVLACGLDDCLRAHTPPCHRHQPARNCNQEHFAGARPPVVKPARCVIAAIAPATSIAQPMTDEPAPAPFLYPPQTADVRLSTPLRI
jgi:hypothetical protein